MDQTLVESRQLDLLFAQMLAERSNREENRNNPPTTSAVILTSEAAPFNSLHSYTFGSEGNKTYDPEEIAKDMRCPWKGK